jgi:hypothetical protein
MKVTTEKNRIRIRQSKVRMRIRDPYQNVTVLEHCFFTGRCYVLSCIHFYDTRVFCTLDTAQIPGLRIRIRIESEFNRVSGSGSGFGIRIWIQEGKNEPQK